MENRIVQLIENLNILTKSIFYFLAFLFISTTYTFANSPEVTAVRIGGDENKTRFVLEINNDITFRTLSLANPNRVVIDLDEVIWKIGPGGAAGQGLINNYRYGLYLPGTSRIVLDLKKPAKLSNSFVIKGKGRKADRLVFDFERISQTQFISGLSTPELRIKRESDKE